MKLLGYWIGTSPVSFRYYLVFNKNNKYYCRFIYNLGTPGEQGNSVIPASLDDIAKEYKLEHNNDMIVYEEFYSSFKYKLNDMLFKVSI